MRVILFLPPLVHLRSNCQLFVAPPPSPQAKTIDGQGGDKGGDWKWGGSDAKMRCVFFAVCLFIVLFTPALTLPLLHLQTGGQGARGGETKNKGRGPRARAKHEGSTATAAPEKPSTNPRSNRAGEKSPRSLPAPPQAPGEPERVCARAPARTYG